MTSLSIHTTKYGHRMDRFGYFNTHNYSLQYFVDEIIRVHKIIGTEPEH